MANGMAALYVGASGLQSAQTALNTTAHNLSNINTIGYTRQQITFNDTQYMTIGESATSLKQYGIGVAVSEIRRVRDEFIDRAYRKENGRLGYYSSQYDALQEVEVQFGEMQGVTFEGSLDNLYAAMNGLSTNPTSTVHRAALIQYASAFIDRATSIYNGLLDYQNTLNTNVMNMVNRINELGQTVSDLNKKIETVQAIGESPNDLRDARDVALDELSSYIKIQYSENAKGVITVKAEGVPFVLEDGINKMSVEKEGDTELLKPVWGAFNRDVFIKGETIDSVSNNDSGALKGLLVARGDRRVNYTDVPVEPDMPLASNYATDAEYQTAYAKYEEDYAAYKVSCTYYNTYIDGSVILSTMAGLDKLVNGIVTAINDVLCPNKEAVTYATALQDADGNDIEPTSYIYDADGNITGYTYIFLDQDETSYGMDEDKTIGEELFSRKYTNRYNVSELADGSKVYVFNNKNTLGIAMDYTLGTLIMNPNVKQDTSKIPLSKQDGGEDYTKAEALLDVWSEKFASLNPSTYAKQDFRSFYSNLVGEFAMVGEVLENYVSNQQTMVNGYDNQRLQTEGVSSDEELQNMIKFQQAYNASSRYINVVNEMIEHLITRLGS